MLPSNIVYNENGFRIEVIFKEGETPNGLFYVRQREKVACYFREGGGERQVRDGIK